VEGELLPESFDDVREFRIRVRIRVRIRIRVRVRVRIRLRVRGASTISGSLFTPDVGSTRLPPVIFLLIGEA